MDSPPQNYARYHLSQNVMSQTQIIKGIASLWHLKMASFRKNEGILVQICNINILVTTQVTRLKCNTFPYFFNMNLYTKFQGFLKTWVLGPYYSTLFDVEFPPRYCPAKTQYFILSVYINGKKYLPDKVSFETQSKIKFLCLIFRYREVLG